MAYTTITTEGGLLPADILATIAELPGQRPDDFGLERNRNLTDAIAAAWAEVRAYWEAAQRSLERNPERATTITRERWMGPLLDVLGYKDLTYTPSAALVNGRTYALSHRAGTGEGAPPIHIEGFNTDIDRRPLSGRPRVSPHALMQEYLNATDDTLWGIVTNGERLRLLRDSSRMTRLAYVEFDLRAMLEGEQFSEFAVLYRVLHRSRLPQPGDDPAQCWLETYHQEALAVGGRVRDGLRDGVEQALVRLGTGLLQHPHNTALRDQIRSGTLSELALYRTLLRLVYRVLFLMVAEERNLVTLDADESDPLLPATYRPQQHERAEVYRQWYSIDRLRRLAEQPAARRSPYDDLWIGLQTTFALFEGSDDRGATLGIAALNGDLFGPNALRDLADTRLRNSDLLTAIFHLSLYRDPDSRELRRVNYGALDVEELGSVYESLLDLRPLIIAPHTAQPAFAFAAGTERKTTGSYYTHPELVQELIGSALEPVIQARLATARTPAEQEQVLLGLTVCDPACGSGHFLLAAARHIGRELARVRSGEDHPTPPRVRAAVRDAISHCIYGVDLNPLAVDLCKLSLWIEGHNAGKSLAFLDAHIRLGNSLVGATEELVAAGIPDEAYKAVTGDDKAVASDLRKRNKQERRAYEHGGIQDRMELPQPATALPRYAAAMQAVEAMPDDTVLAYQRKEHAYDQLLGQLRPERTRFNLWTAAFFLPFTAGSPVPTTADVLRFQRNPHAFDARMSSAADALAQQLNLFHWELEFPHIFSSERGGFDVVLGNPPWERIKLQEKEHWVDVSEIAGAANKAARSRRIQEWRSSDDPAKRERIALFDHALHAADATSRFVRASGRFPLTAVGDVNTYALFAELDRNLVTANGRAGIIVPTGIATDDTTKAFFGDLNSRQQLISLFDFENREAIFPGVHRSYKFCLLTMGDTTEPATLLFFATNVEHLRDDQRRFTLAPTEIALLNPNTRTAPVFRTQADAQLTKKLYRAAPVLDNERTGDNPWGVRFATMFHMSNDSGLFRIEPAPDRVPLYEAKLLHQFTHRWATYGGAGGDGRWAIGDRDGEQGFGVRDWGSGDEEDEEQNADVGANLVFAPSESLTTRELSAAELADPSVTITPRYWVERRHVEERLAGRWDREWLLGFRDIARSTDERTAIFSLLPRVGLGNKVPVLLQEHNEPLSVACFLATVNSLAFDFIVRQKMGGTTLNFFIVKQLPVLPPSAFGAAEIAFIVPRVLELVYTAWDMQPFAEDVWHELDAALRADVLARHAACNGGAGEQGHTGGRTQGSPLPMGGGANHADGERSQFPLPPFMWNEERRAHIRAELDARIARLYGLTRDELRYILDPADVYGPDFPGETFRVLKDKETREHGEYRTRRLVLEAWDGAEG